ncbi:hypothetical protein J8J14_13705 [Roseomonas sp. SSH11]|uniref:Peroxidase n=1 Tax=Pararoseomonas baculiformis TaxID=2820812 RepID=A0ABS4AFL5_9PROT|nr:hypothetical protein [Pararoseomonas baculiformis]MBP0445830.1 hypothetical protein [Pararoseomonas baculiformis]
MVQTILCVALEVKPESAAVLTRLVHDLRQDFDAREDAELGNFPAIQTGIPSAHFLSICLFRHTSYDPLLVIEANFDGPPGPFWSQFERTFGEERLRALLRCCKEPRDNTAALFRAVTARGSRAPVAPYLEARTHWPSASHQGNRGLSRDRIRDEQKLALALEAELDGDPGYRAMAPSAIHARLRERVAPGFPWLDAPAPARIPGREDWLDVIRLGLFGAILLAALLLPGALLHTALGVPLYLSVVAVLAVIAALALRGTGGWKGLLPRRSAAAKRPPEEKPSDNSRIFAALALAVLGAPLLLFLLPALGHLLLVLAGRAEIGELLPLLGRVVTAALWGIAGLVPIAFGLAWLVRHNERRDAPQDLPPIDPATLDEIVRREDRVTQNHMASLVLVRPGIMRSLVIRAGHRGLHLFLRVLPTARKGFLGSMRTVHFAHWSFLDNGSRLVFLSNFDHSWASYLDDFIEKAHGGLTIAWGSSVGFPRTSWLFREGAADGRKFKAYALASRAVSRFWYSAYPYLTVDRIERHAEIAARFRAPALSDEEAAKWLRLL